MFPLVILSGAENSTHHHRQGILRFTQDDRAVIMR